MRQRPEVVEVNAYAKRFSEPLSPEQHAWRALAAWMTRYGPMLEDARLAMDDLDSPAKPKRKKRAAPT